MAVPPHLRAKKAPSHNKTVKKGTTGELPPASDKSNAVGEPAPDLNSAQDQGTAGAKPHAKRAGADIHDQRPALTVIGEKKQNTLQVPSGQSTSGAYIRQKLQEEHGVKVTAPKPAEPAKVALVPYPSSNEDGHPSANGGAKAANGRSQDGKTKASSARSSKGKQANGADSDRRSNRGGATNHRGRGRGGALQGRLPRESRWPKTADTRPDPHRWDKDIKWNDSSSDVDSAEADSGFGSGKKKKKRDDGIDEETGFILTDWTGGFAPAPVDWDARPAFRDTQSAQQIDLWRARIEEEMCGKQWGIPNEQVSPPEDADLAEKDLTIGEVAPRYWIPVVIGKQAPRTFWNELVNSKEPESLDEDDLNDAKPWWELYQVKDGNFLRPCEHPEIKGIDPDENQDERLARENDFGSAKHTDNRKRTEKAKRDAQRERRKRAQEKARKISESAPVFKQSREKIKPDLNLYIRSAKPVDIPDIRKIYNHYVSYSVCAPETERRTNADMLQRYKDIIANKLPFLVCCERGAKIKAKKKNKDGEDMVLPDRVIGFASADDYNDLRGMYRFTAELEVYVDNSCYMKGVAKCLLDKLMGMLDSEYMERGGYDTFGEELEGVGPARVIQNLIVNMPYVDEKYLAWKGEWLEKYGFERVGHLKGIGNKEGKSVTLAIFQRTTGANIDAAKPPITMEYPS